MAKYKRKVSTALAARRKGYEETKKGRDSAAEMAREPGSQNRKKGYGNGKGRR